MRANRRTSFTVLILMLVLFSLAGKAQPAEALGTNCATTTLISGATVTVCITAPADGAALSGEAQVTASASVSAGGPRVQRLVFYLDNAYLLTDFQSPYAFILPTARFVDGAHNLSLKATLSSGEISSPAGIGLTFNNGVTTPPVNGNQFVPSGGTQPAPGSAFLLAVGGDGASGEVYAGKVSDLVVAQNPNMFIYLGDVYEKGSLSEFYNWYGTPTLNFGRLRAITNPTIGNHEYENGVAPGYFDYWDNIPNYYSYNAAGWHFVSLNSNLSSTSLRAGGAEYNWLKQDLAANPGVCTIVYYHHPLFNIGAEPAKTSLTDIWALMAQYRVDIVLNGHDHDYQRWVPLNGAGQPDPNGVTEFVAGAAGHGVQAQTQSDSRVAAFNFTNPTAFGVLLFQLNSQGASFSYLNTTGAVLDSGVIPCFPSIPDTQAPGAPPSLSANAASATRVDLAWAASLDNVGVAGYSIYRNGALLASLSGASLSFSDTTAMPNTAYTYAVDAFDLAGNHSTASAPASLTTPPMPPRLTFTPAADTYVNSGSPTSTYGSATSLRVDASPDLHAYLRFNVQGLGGSTISRARLLVYTNSSSSLGLTALAVADNTWSEAGTNYNNAPALGGLLATATPISAGTWVSLDVTPYITGEGVYSFGLSTPSSSTLSMASRETGATAAQLVLDLP